MDCKEEEAKLRSRIDQSFRCPNRLVINEANVQALRDGFKLTLAHDQLVWETAFAEGCRGGLFLQFIFGRVLWPAMEMHKRVYRNAIRCIGTWKLDRECKKNSGQLEDPVVFGVHVRWFANDAYFLGYFLLVTLMYFVAFAVAMRSPRDGFHLGELLLLPSLVLAIARLYEVVAFLAVLHTRKEYRTKAAPRAMVNTLIHYAEACVAFGILYIGCAVLCDDKFDDARNDLIASGASWFNPIYFSLITISTLGYGDFSPQSVIGKGLVCFEVFFGIGILVIVIQRVLSAKE